MHGPARGAGVIVLGAFLLLSAGCGSSSQQASGPTTTATAAPPTPTTVTPVTPPTTVALKDPCTYVSAAEVQQATGATVTSATQANDFVCSYHTKDGGVVNVTVASPVTRASLESDLKAQTTSGTLPPTMSGLGDVAYQTNGGVQVLKGNHGVNVDVFLDGRSGGPANPGSVALARLILGRI